MAVDDPPLDGVSPASAGIGPVVMEITPALASFPRVRGDRPASIDFTGTDKMFPPRPRG